MEQELRHQQSELEGAVQKRTLELQEALEVKSRFLATMSHGKNNLFCKNNMLEIRTPLSGILGMMLLLAESKLTSEQQDMVHIAHICGEQLLVLIKDILDFTKVKNMSFSLFLILLDGRK
jgi:signal transduction histidine kinase